MWQSLTRKLGVFTGCKFEFKPLIGTMIKVTLIYQISYNKETLACNNGKKNI